jgi:hypothetical protein
MRQMCGARRRDVHRLVEMSKQIGRIAPHASRAGLAKILF